MFYNLQMNKATKKQSKASINCVTVSPNHCNAIANWAMFPQRAVTVTVSLHQGTAGRLADVTFLVTSRCILGYWTQKGVFGFVVTSSIAKL